LHYSFRLSHPDLEGTVILVERHRHDASGDLESGFLFGVEALRRHHSGAWFGAMLADLAEQPDTRHIIAIRNPDLVLDDGLAGRIAEATGRLAAMPLHWSIAAARGLEPDEARNAALYSAKSPFIPWQSEPRPLIDPLPDLTIFDPAYLSRLTKEHRMLPNPATETVLAVQGYLDGRIALFLPELSAGVNGALRPRDMVELQRELTDWFAEQFGGQRIRTLMGPVEISPQRQNGVVCSARPARSAGSDLDERLEAARDAAADPLTLSIVTRTRFDRSRLLARLLTSVSRARIDAAEIEVILSSDAPADRCCAETERLQRCFGNLAIRLQHNRAEGHNRVTNLIGGIRAASHDYVAILDDDDYVDLFAFGALRRAPFLGQRPLIAMASVLHDVTWVETPLGRHVVTQSSERDRYPAGGWRAMFGGVNRLPISALAIPRSRLVERLSCCPLAQDLSEDYALFLLILTDPALPAIAELPDVFTHISVRADGDNSITMADRRPWVRDIAGFWRDLTRSTAVVGQGHWALLTANAADPARSLHDKTVAELRAGLAERDREIRLVSHELARLRPSTARAQEAAR